MGLPTLQFCTVEQPEPSGWMHAYIRQTEHWLVQSFTPLAGYIAALAVDNPEISLCFWQG